VWDLIWRSLGFSDRGRIWKPLHIRQLFGKVPLFRWKEGSHMYMKRFWTIKKPNQFPKSLERYQDRWRCQLKHGSLEDMGANSVMNGAVVTVLGWPVQHGRGKEKELWWDRSAREMELVAPNSDNEVLACLIMRGVLKHKRMTDTNDRVLQRLRRWTIWCWW